MFYRSSANLVTGGKWYRIVEDYLLRALTRCEDIFPALSGVVNEVTKRMGFIYRAGIWLEDFHRGLAWAIKGNSDRVGSYIAPSWSWASIKTPVDRTPDTEARHTETWDPDLQAEYFTTHWPMPSKLIDCNITLQRKDPFGQITNATIVLRGLWLQFSNWEVKKPIRIGTLFAKKKKPLHHKGIQWSIDCNFDEPLIEDHRVGSEEDVLVDPDGSILDGLCLLHISVFRLYRCYQLTLMPTADRGENRRVGLAYAYIEEFKAAGKWEMREVTII